MTRKEYVLQLTEAIKENPRSVFMNHGIAPTVLKQLALRDDLIAKIANFIFSTKYFKKGAKGAKKTAQLQIKGYKNYNELVAKSQIDINAFSEKVEGFTNEDNILVFLATPDSKTAAGENTEENIIAGKSVAMDFQKAIKKEYKIQGGFYIIVMFDSAIIRPKVETLASAKSKQNSMKSKRRTPQKIKAELIAKAKSRLDRISGAVSQLTAKRDFQMASVDQIHNLGTELVGHFTNENSLLSGFKAYDKSMAKLRKSIPAKLSKVFDLGVATAKKGKKAEAKAILNTISPKVADMVVNELPASTSDAISSKASAIKSEMRRVQKEIAKLKIDIELAPTVSLKQSSKRMLRDKEAALVNLKARLSGLTLLGKEGLKAKDIKSKSAVIASLNSEIDKMVEKGATIRGALQTAIAKLDARISPARKQQIKQQIIAQVESGTPTQYAVQQVIQQLPQVVQQQLGIQQVVPQQQVAQQAFQQLTPAQQQVVAQQAFQQLTPAQQQQVMANLQTVQQVPSLTGTASIDQILALL